MIWRSKFVYGLALYALAALATMPVAEADIAAWSDLRERNTIIQAQWWTCGAAALATLLTFYYGEEVSEADVLADVFRLWQPAEQAPSGLSMAVLAGVLKLRGTESNGFRLTEDDLVEYFRSGGPPVILHFTRPKAHYVLAVGLVDRLLAIADPSFGERLISIDALRRDKGFQGYVLVPFPAPEEAETVARLQSLALARFAGRLYRLTKLGGDLYTFH